jgi:hypothetical protein
LQVGPLATEESPALSLLNSDACELS